MIWNNETESKLLRLRSEGKTYSEIGNILGTTATSAKHKTRRLQQADNQDRYKHTDEKRRQVDKFVSGFGLHTLETHCGFGCMTEKYHEYGSVMSIDIKQDRVDAVNAKMLDDVTCIKADSEREVLLLLYHKCVFDVVDVDPYGLPSRYFPNVFGLINDGWLFLTFPMLGVAQINKITIEHYRSFWGIELSDKDEYVEKITHRLKQYAFMHKREIKVFEIVKIGRIYRMAIRVKKSSLCDIVGLTVNRNKSSTN